MNKKTSREINYRKRSLYLGILAVASILFLSVVLALPSCVAFTVNKIIRNITVKNGSMVCRVTQIGFFQANIALQARQKAETGPSRRPRVLLELPHCRIQYTPWGLLCGRIEAIEIIGATIPLRLDNGRIKIPVSELFAMKSDKSVSRKDPEPLPNIGSVHLKNSAVAITIDGNFYYIPFSAELSQGGDGGWNTPSLKGAFTVNGNQIYLKKTTFSVPRGLLSGGLLLRNVRLDNLPYPLNSYLEPYRVEGLLNYDVSFSCDLNKQTVLSLKSKGSIRNFSMSVQSKNLNSKLLETNLDFDGQNGTFQLGGLDVDQYAVLKKMNWRFNLTPEKTTVGVLTVEPGEGGPITMNSSSRFLKTEKTLEINFSDVSSPAGLNLRFCFPPEKQTASATFRAISVTGKPGRVFIRKGEFRAERKNAEISGFLSADFESVSVYSCDLSAKSGTLHLPFALGKTTQGSFRLGSSVWRGNPLCSVDSSLNLNLERLDHVRFSASGTAVWTEHPSIRFHFRSENAFSSSGFSSENKILLKETKIPVVSFGKYHKSLAGLRVSGKVGMTAGLSIRPGDKPTGTATVLLKNVSISDPSKKLDISGLDASFTLPRLPEPVSAPGMKISARRIKSGTLDVRNLLLKYRMESPALWTVESIRADWAGGVVRVGSFVLDLTDPQPEIEAFCDRVKLTEIFSQFGKNCAKGDGSLSGMIPFSIRNGKIQFGDGFLCSIPGQKGLLQLDDSGLLTAGVPEKSSYYAQLKFSGDALRDFSYNWAKLSLANSKKNTLVLRLKLDGKPARPLPYTYSNGRFLQIEGLTDFAGVVLDVNFNIQLDALLRTVADFKKLFEKL